MTKKHSILDEVLEEAFSDGSSMFGGAKGSSGFSYSQTAGARTWAPQSPINRSATGDEHGYNIKDIADEEAALKHNAPLKRPFPLETIHDQLVQAFLCLANAEAQMKTCRKYNAVLDANQEKKALLEHLHKKIQGVQEMIKSISQDLDKISLT